MARQSDSSTLSSTGVRGTIRLEDLLDALVIAQWRTMRARNRQAGVTHYELTFVVNEDAVEIHVRNYQKDLADPSARSLQSLQRALGSEVYIESKT